MSNKITINAPIYSSTGDFYYDPSNRWHHTVNSGHTITVEDTYSKRIIDLENKFDKIMERLNILDDPDPEKLEKHKILRDAYKKYKMIETLIGEQDGGKSESR